MSLTVGLSPSKTTWPVVIWVLPVKEVSANFWTLLSDLETWQEVFSDDGVSKKKENCGNE